LLSLLEVTQSKILSLDLNVTMCVHAMHVLTIITAAV